MTRPASVSLNVLLANLIILLAAAPAAAGKYNPTLSIGDDAPAWTNLPGVDGKRHSLADLKEKDLVVVVFTCNSCDVATEYEDRILDFTRRYCDPEGRVAMVAINVNLIEEDSLPQMKKRAESRGFPFPYLFDETQQIARDYGAVFTPEFFVLDKERRIAYMGGMDDASDAKFVEQRYLAPAIEALLEGKQPVVTETVAIGCTVRYSRRRSPR
ncbi:MAG: thioredoxin family protein [Planctomycetales bacterium]|nr:thioredoxin family protein [Planctomycetales bacterium]